jgi:hypothetical protein
MPWPRELRLLLRIQLVHHPAPMHLPCLVSRCTAEMVWWLAQQRRDQMSHMSFAALLPGKYVIEVPTHPGTNNAVSDRNL